LLKSEKKKKSNCKTKLRNLEGEW
jgi:hypothetical protein